MRDPFPDCRNYGNKPQPSFQKQLDAETRLLQEIFSRHLKDSSISQEALDALEEKLAGFLTVKQGRRTIRKYIKGYV